MYYDCHTHRKPHSIDTFGLFNVRYGTSEAPLPTCVFSVGIHPWDCSEAHIDDGFRSLAMQAAAIGECGLDRACSAPMTLQLAVFEQQIALAAEIRKPMIIHCVRCYQELLLLSRKHRGHTTWILHAFYASAELTQLFAKENVFFSFGHRELSRPKTRRLLSIIPPNRILTETDEALTPIAPLVEFLAQHYGLTVADMASRIEQNYFEAMK